MLTSRRPKWQGRLAAPTDAGIPVPPPIGFVLAKKTEAIGRHLFRHWSETLNSIGFVLAFS